MPDKKLTDSEIVKDCKNCIRYTTCIFCIIGGRSISKDCNDFVELDTINSLQAENERLKNFKAYFDFYFGCDIEILGIDENGDTISFDEFYNCAIANAESIEHHIAHIIKTAKAEAYKEFAERLKENSIATFSWNGVVLVEEIDNLVKEMVGDNQ